jgi:hypothetical protein
MADRGTAGAPGTLRADLASGATLVGLTFGVLALLGGSVVAAFGVSTEAGVVVAGLSSVTIVACTLTGAQEMGPGFGAALGVLIATIVAVAIAIGVSGAILLPLLVVPACAIAVGAAIGAGRMYTIADRR